MKRLFLIESAKNGGYGYGNNLGITYSHNKLKSQLCVDFKSGCKFY
jgi:GT2 family glycosyltransferase